MNSFDYAVSQAAARARLLETLLHDKHRWKATLYGADTEWHVPLTRAILEDEQQVVLTGYAPEGCLGANIAEIYCGHYLQTVLMIPESDGPFRFRFDIGVEVVAA
jgi:hypothetical protein